MLGKLLAEFWRRRRPAEPTDAREANPGAPRMTAERIEQGRRAVIDRYGRWTAHNIHLGHGLYTIGPGPTGDETKLRRVVQTVVDTAGAPLQGLRILDLACLEGMYAVEFARRGSEVVGIEGREANIAKARFAKEALGLENAAFQLDDVRNFSQTRFGQFDVVLCLGILYHLDAPEAFELLERIAEACTRITVIDTHVSLRAEESRSYRGRTYWGRTHQEHRDGVTLEEKRKALWASLDNDRSFFPTRESLISAMAAAGFTSVYECHLPFEPDKPTDRVTLLAIKGRKAKLEGAPPVAESVDRLHGDMGAKRC